MREKNSKPSIRIVAENADLSSLDKRFLTNDVYAILYCEDKNDHVDLIKGKMVDIFDAYYDLGVEIKRIWHAGGYRNPKLQSCELRVKT